MNIEISKKKILSTIIPKLVEIRSFLEQYGFCSEEIK